MPFITQDRRAAIDMGITPPQPKPGDYCYPAYKKMVTAWAHNPSWTTAHNIYANLGRGHGTRDVAERLAWQVFFVFYVIPYEIKKMEENGDIQPEEPQHELASSPSSSQT